MTKSAFLGLQALICVFFQVESCSSLLSSFLFFFFFFPENWQNDQISLRPWVKCVRLPHKARSAKWAIACGGGVVVVISMPSARPDYVTTQPFAREA